MKSVQAIALGLVVTTMLSCNQGKKEKQAAASNGETTAPMELREETTLTLQLQPKNNSEVTGTATFKEQNGTVMMQATLSGLSQGSHAIHLHEKADCSAADGTSAGGHWNPTFQPHGQWGTKAGYHKGDIGNFTADAQGNATVEFATSEWCMGCEDNTQNIMDKAIIVHQGSDDYSSQPAGAAGARIACVGIIQ